METFKCHYCLRTLPVTDKSDVESGNDMTVCVYCEKEVRAATDSARIKYGLTDDPRNSGVRYIDKYGIESDDSGVEWN